MNKLPFRVTLLIWLVLILTAWNILQFWTSLAWRATLLEFSTRPAPIIISIVSMALIITGVLILYGIWRRKLWTVKVLLFAAAGNSAWYWADRLIWQEPRPNWPFAVIVNLALILFMIFTTKSLAREAYDRKSIHQEIE
jgi:hypothetical protein